MITCEICGKQCKPLGIAGHMRLAHSDEGKKWIAEMQSRRDTDNPWNKGKTAKTDARLKDSGKKISTALQGKGHAQSAETKKKISETMKKNGAGGYRPGSGVGKSGWYKNIWCDSSWELAFVLFCEMQGKEIKRSKQTFKYELDGKIRTYHPDFEVDDRLIEIKGRRKTDAEIEAKLASCPSIEILLEAQMTPILEEVVRKYGKQFVSLYK